jgi:hypothetical protein
MSLVLLRLFDPASSLSPLVLHRFGIVVFYGGFKRTCLVICTSSSRYTKGSCLRTDVVARSDLFGDSRQLYPWELRDNSHDLDNQSLSSTPSSLPSIGEKSGHDDYSPSAVNSSPRSSFAYPDLGYFPLAAPSSPSLSERSQNSEAASHQRLYFAPEHVLPKLAASSPTWAPFTTVVSPFVCREQRDNVLKACGVAFVVMCLTAAICFSGELHSLYTLGKNG